MTMSAFLTELGTFFTQSITWVGEIIEVVVANPALLIMTVGVSIVGFAFGLTRRLIRL